MASMLTCQICLGQKSYRKPKSLHCLHSFCRDCLQSWLDTRQRKEYIECPVCRQYTKIPPHGIDGLVNDFKVHQLEEMMRTLGDPLVCQGCLLKGQSSKAKVKCLTCDRRLCESCNHYHSREKIFDKHQVATELCEVHGNGISHVCITCFQGLCVDCILSGVHQSHDMYKRDVGKQKLKDLVTEKRKQLTDIKTEMKIWLRTAEERIGQTIEFNIAKLKESADAMKQEIDRQVSEVNKRYRKQIKQNLMILGNSFEEQHRPRSIQDQRRKYMGQETINTLIRFVSDLNKEIKEITYAEQNARGMAGKLDIDNDTLTNVGRPLSLYHHYIKTSESDGRMKEILFKEVSGTPKLVFAKHSEMFDEIGIPLGMEIMNDCTAVVAFHEWDHVLRIDENGRVVALYYCDGSHGANKVGKLATGVGNIYILCLDRCTLIQRNVDSFNKTFTRKINLPPRIISFTFNPYNNTFLVSQDSPSGKVYRYRETDIIPEECSLPPGNIQVLPHAGSYRVVVASHYANTVMMYDEDDRLLYTLKSCGDKGPFLYPSGVALLGHNTQLVADGIGHRICKFKLSDGSFDGILLDKADGIEHPAHIACKYPYIWVAGRWYQRRKGYGSLKLFKWP